jgi:hypothetical protein
MEDFFLIFKIFFMFPLFLTILVICTTIYVISKTDFKKFGLGKKEEKDCSCNNCSCNNKQILND